MVEEWASLVIPLARAQRAQKQVHGTAKRAHIYSGFCFGIFLSGKKKGAWLPDTGLGRTDFPPSHVSDFIEFNVIPLYHQEAFLRRKYLDEQLSIKQIAVETFASRSAIKNQMNRFGIPIRTGEIARKLNLGQIGYGEKRQKSKKAIHLRELQTIIKIQELRNNGHSYRQIAAILDTMQIPTKTRRSGWKAATVLSLLKRHEHFEYEERC